MIRRLLIPCLFLTFLFVAGEASLAEARTVAAGRPAIVQIGGLAAQRRAIRQMPLLERPDRFGHFIGNTVRRRYR
jgi:hypothetical protein